MNTNRTGRALARTALVAAAALALAACFENSPVDELTPDGDGGIDIDGTWSGVVASTLIEDTTQETVELSIADGDVAVSGGSADGSFFPADLSGTVTPQAAGRFTVTFENDGAQTGLLIADSTGQFAALIVDESSAASHGYVSVLQKADLQTPSHVEDDLIGSWEGIAVRVNSDYSVTDSFVSSAVIDRSEVLFLEGDDDDGTFSAGEAGFSAGIRQVPGFNAFFESGFESDRVVWPDADASYDAIYALSYDQDVLAVAFLDDFSGNGSPMANLPNQKFALWQRQ